VAAATALVALVGAAKAGAGTYRTAVCDPRIGAWHADSLFRRTSRHYVGQAACGADQPGLTIRHEGTHTDEGRWGGWILRAPRGTAIARLGVSAAGRRAGGHVPELLTVPFTGTPVPFASPDTDVGRAQWSGPPARELIARLSCQRESGCRAGRRSRLRIKRVSVRLIDRLAPHIQVGGSILHEGSRRGEQTLQASASDVGGGIHRFLLQVNGQPLTAHTAPCKTADGVALRLRPCPSGADTTFRVATDSGPFRQGINVVRVCAIDYAVGTAAGRECAERRVRIDNLCPVSSVRSGTRLEARLVRARSSRRTASRGRAIVRGRLRSASGGPVAGATVCVATRVSMTGAVERVVATPTTGPDGRFSARLGPGPNRAVRVAYWPGPSGAIESTMRLRVHARPRLKLQPRHAISNGHHVRFEVTLPGPAAAHRRVRIQARAGHRWVELRFGRTGRRAVFHARYRFHATTGRRRYAFRAIVPAQHGYPYRAGRSEVRRVTVIG
jgi:hypothetical protein